MTTPEQLAEMVREALDGGVPLLYAEDRKARREKAEAALDSLLAFAAAEEVIRADFQAELLRQLEEMRRERDELAALVAQAAAERELGEWQNRFELIAEENRDNLACLQAAEREVSELKQLTDDYEKLRNETADERDAAERERDGFRHEAEKQQERYFAREREVERLRGSLLAIIEEFRSGSGGYDEDDPVVVIARAALGRAAERKRVNERYATDPDYRSRIQAKNAAGHARRKARKG